VEARKCYWKSFVHNGVYLPTPHEYLGLSITVHGKPFKLSPEAEEMAFEWAKVMKHRKASDPVFRANFFRDFSRYLNFKPKPKSLDEIDFSNVRKAYVRQKIRFKLNKRMANERKKIKRQLKEKYGYAVVDGRRVEIANWMVEPPGIFMGRGNHPLRGRWKPRVTHRDVTLNLSKDAEIPEGNWGKIVHDASAMWVAKWKDRLTGKIKYVWLHEGSRIRQDKDKEKYEKALRLSSRIGRIRKHIIRGMHSRNRELRKVATACYLIDKLGLRVGDEKEADEADTVGATTLRVEHLTIKQKVVEFRFLGKDSVEWHKSIRLSQVDPRFVQNLQELIKNKKPTDQIFDTVSSASVNKFLGGFMPGLTAKVFRTYHATRVVKNFLMQKTAKARRSNRFVKLYYAKLANLEAAKFCNHKRTVPGSYRSALKKKHSKLHELTKKSAKNGKQARKLKQKVVKLQLEAELIKQTKDYNLTTSLKNYIDPRIYKAWADRVNLDWKEIYSKSLQKKFGWASRSKWRWFNGKLNSIKLVENDKI
jgi:DNA topoisomerase-1